MKAILATKVGMTQLYTPEGKLQPVTVLQAGPCVITQLKTIENDGYSAAQLGFGTNKKTGKVRAGHLKASGAENLRHLKEVRTEELIETDTEGENVKVGQEIKADVFEVGDKVVVSGVSKGKGFAGTIKRHNFHRGPMTHGSHNHRAPGSIGAGYPQHVMKGMKMACRMGHDKVSVKNLVIAQIDVDRNLIAVVGAVPGPRKGLVFLRGMSL